jgi:hypothetical protein
VELKKMQEENENLKNELENAQKYVSELCILHLARQLAGKNVVNEH